jgi:acyl-CoA dehydrogenase
MNFEFSEDQRFIQDQARSFLSQQCTAVEVRQVLESDQPMHEGLWRQVQELGWPATAIPEEYGGLGLGYLELCVLAEELGRSLLPVPLSSSTYMAAEAIKLYGSEEQKSRYLPGLASGESIGTLAVSEAGGSFRNNSIKSRVAKSALNGEKHAVQDATVADLAIVAAQSAESNEFSLYLVDLTQNGIERVLQDSMDPSRPVGRINFNGVEAELLGELGNGKAQLSRLYDGAAVLLAFEQVGGADAALNMAKEYTMGRYAFGRPVASFQAIKHKLADMFVAIELARSNAYYGAWALSSDSEELPLAAATARVSATEAFWQVSKENIQAHGGMGFTWEFDCHLYYRRAQHLGLALGSLKTWKDQLVDRLCA